MPTTTQTLSYGDWYIPLHRDHLTLREARESQGHVGAGPQDIPLMVQLVENPKYRMPGLEIFHGAVGLEQHDNIHILLGRGLLEMDEAFTIGFTMGSTKKVTTAEETLFSLIARYLYPQVYQFDSDNVAVFRDAVRLGYISGCAPLNEFDFQPYMECPLKELRRAVGLESDLLLAYYRIEKRRYPNNQASQRLLDK